MLPQFKDAIKEVGIDKLRVRIGDAITQKEQTVIAVAVAKAKAETDANAVPAPRGGMFGSIFM